MKRYILILASILVCWSCGNNKTKQSEESKEPTMQIIKGERSSYGVLGSVVYLPTKDTTEFGIKIYQAEDALILESPRILIGNLFGIKSSTGVRDRLKYSFTFIGKENEQYIYAIPYTELPHFFGTYYTLNMEYCWIYYDYDDNSNNPDMVEFSKTEFEQYFDIVKAHICN